MDEGAILPVEEITVTFEEVNKKGDWSVVRIIVPSGEASPHPEEKNTSHYPNFIPLLDNLSKKERSGFEPLSD